MLDSVLVGCGFFSVCPETQTLYLHEERARPMQRLAQRFPACSPPGDAVFLPDHLEVIPG